MLDNTKPDVGADLSAAFGTIDFQKCRKIIVAVSGGSDSMALLVGLKAYIDARCLPCALFAATVDHQLRLASAAEANHVAGFCAAHGIAHHILAWSHGGITHGLQQKARMARYGLLAQLAMEQGADLVVTGHTLDDQMETVAMRQKRGGGRGEAGIASATCYNRTVWFCRPLLGQSRAVLREMLAARRIDWIDDPSNQSDTFERVRVRKAGVCPQVLATIGAAQMKRFEEARNAAHLLAAPQVATTIERECAEIASSLIDHHGGITALAALLTLVGEKPHAPNKGALRQAASFVAESRSGTKLTLHGCLLTHCGASVRIKREARHCAGGHVGFDRLVPVFDLAMINALYRRLGEPQLPHLALAAASY